MTSINEIGLNCKITRFIIVQYYYAGHNPGYEFGREQIKIPKEQNDRPNPTNKHRRLENDCCSELS